VGTIRRECLDRMLIVNRHHLEKVFGEYFKSAFDRVEAETGVKLSNASVIGRVWGNLVDYQTDVLSRAGVGNEPLQRPRSRRGGG
jgi:hypothetical protein